MKTNMCRTLCGALLCALSLTVGSQPAWPEKVVTIEEMTLLTTPRVSVPTVREKGDVKRPAVLQVHINQDGLVQRVALYESCGSPVHDEAAIQAMRDMKFKPRQENGVPVDVTLLVPFHLPLSKTPYR